jgi:hypothetical protein
VSDIKFHSGSKLAWIEQVTIDRRSTGLEVRLAVAISRRLKDDGATIATQATLANIIGASERGVRKAAIALRANGHLNVDAVGSGPGTATTYRPIFKRRNGSSGFEGQQADERRNCSSGKNDARKPEQISTKGGTAVPPHKNPSKSPIKNPGARASAGDNPPDADPLQVCWQAVKQRLTQALGREVFDSWFGKVTLAQIEGGIAWLGTPSKFVAKWLTDHYAELTMEAWRAELPDLIGLRFDPRPPAAADDALPAAKQRAVQR